MTYALVSSPSQTLTKYLDESRLEALLLTCDVNAISAVVGSHGPDVRTDSDLTLLMICARDGLLASAAILLAHRADLTLTTPSGETALHLAARNGHADIATLLLQAGAPLDAVDECGRTPLWCAAAHNLPDSEIVDVLLQAGADTKKRDHNGVAPQDMI